MSDLIADIIKAVRLVKIGGNQPDTLVAPLTTVAYWMARPRRNTPRRLRKKERRNARRRWLRAYNKNPVFPSAEVEESQ